MNLPEDNMVFCAVTPNQWRTGRFTEWFGLMSTRDAWVIGHPDCWTFQLYLDEATYNQDVDYIDDYVEKAFRREYFG